MMRMAWAAALAAVLACVTVQSVEARGGGGGHYVYIPVMIYNAPVQPMPAQIGDYSKIHTVAILSGIGQSMTIVTGGIGTPNVPVDISDFGLDDAMTATLGKYLGTGYRIVPATFDRAALARIPNGKYDLTSAAATREYLKTVQAPQADAFIVVRPDTEGNASFGAGLSLVGSDGSGKTYVAAGYEIDVIDAHTLKTIGHTFSRLQTREKAQIGFAAAPTASDLKIPRGSPPTPGQRLQLKADYSDLLAVSAVETLRSLNMSARIPAPGDHSILPHPDVPAAATGHNVAIVSVVGQRLRFVSPGGMATTKSDSDMDISAWHVDADIEKLVAAALAKRYTVKPASVDRAALANFLLASSGTADNLPGLTPSKDVDIYVLVLNGANYLPSPQSRAGIGLARLSDFVATTNLYADYMIVAVDAHTLKPIAMHQGILSNKYDRPFPMEQIGTRFWPETPGTLSPDAEAVIRNELGDFLADSVPETLFRAGLTGQDGTAPTVTAGGH